MPPPWNGADRGRLFDVECECGEEFRVAYDPEGADRRPGDPFLARLSGSCPWCGLRLEEIEPFGEGPLRLPSSPEPRSRA